jgi:hypothetical protein
MESPSHSLFGQNKGTPTTRCYNTATIFVNRYSRLSYVHLQSSSKGDKTVQGKHTFENYARSHDVSIKHYHCNNGQFVDHAFLEEIRAQQQNITFCSVNAHFQNGIVKRKIRKFQDMARTSLLNHMAHCPRALNTHRWSYTLRTANEVLVSTPKHVKRKSAISMFSGTDVIPKINLLCLFGCPVYVLDIALQADNHLSKWFKHARVGIYMGMSTIHARYMTLVLNVQTGLVLPLLHIEFDSIFGTVRQAHEGLPTQWQVATHFCEENDPSQYVKANEYHYNNGLPHCPHYSHCPHGTSNNATWANSQTVFFNTRPTRRPTSKRTP